MDEPVTGYRRARGAAPAPPGSEPAEVTIRKMRGGWDEGYAAGLRAGIERAALILRVWAGHYPTDIFPEGGKSVDCQSAAFARHLCREIELDVLALLAAPEPEQP